MKLIRFLIFLLFIVASCQKKRISDVVPEYKFLREFSYKIKPETGLVLWSFSFNDDLPKGYKIGNKIGNFGLSYALIKNRDSEISIEEARNFVVFVVERLLQEAESHPQIGKKLEVRPFVADRVRVSVYFVDENRVNLGQGIAEVHYMNGKIKYEGYKIESYTGRYPARGKSYDINTETYAEALEIVKKNGGPKKLVY